MSGSKKDEEKCFISRTNAVCCWMECKLIHAVRVIGILLYGPNEKVVNTPSSVWSTRKGLEGDGNA